jgi:hypothetical protein
MAPWHLVRMALLCVLSAGLLATGVADWPLGLVTLGTSMNLLVVVANRNKMPVVGAEEPWLRVSGRHVVVKEGHRLTFLADRIPVGPFLLVSPGDVLAWVGVLAMLVTTFG